MFYYTILEKVDQLTKSD